MVNKAIALRDDRPAASLVNPQRAVHPTITQTDSSGITSPAFTVDSFSTHIMAENSLTDSPNPAAPRPELATSVVSEEPKPSYVKLAMRNMVRKGGKSLFHFTLTVIALLGLLVGLSYLTR